MMTKVHYCIVYTKTRNWKDPHAWDFAYPEPPTVKHRTVIAAAKRYDKLQRQCRAASGQSASLLIKIGRSCADGGYEPLTAAEQEEVDIWENEQDWKRF